MKLILPTLFGKLNSYRYTGYFTPFVDRFFNVWSDFPELSKTINSYGCTGMVRRQVF